MQQTNYETRVAIVDYLEEVNKRVSITTLRKAFEQKGYDMSLLRDAIAILDDMGIVSIDSELRVYLP